MAGRAGRIVDDRPEWTPWIRVHNDQDCAANVGSHLVVDRNRGAVAGNWRLRGSSAGGRIAAAVYGSGGATGEGLGRCDQLGG